MELLKRFAFSFSRVLAPSSRFLEAKLQTHLVWGDRVDKPPFAADDRIASPSLPFPWLGGISKEAKFLPGVAPVPSVVPHYVDAWWSLALTSFRTVPAVYHFALNASLQKSKRSLYYRAIKVVGLGSPPVSSPRALRFIAPVHSLHLNSCLFRSEDDGGYSKLDNELCAVDAKKHSC